MTTTTGSFVEGKSLLLFRGKSPPVVVAPPNSTHALDWCQIDSMGGEKGSPLESAREPLLGGAQAQPASTPPPSVRAPSPPGAPTLHCGSVTLTRSLLRAARRRRRSRTRIRRSRTAHPRRCSPSRCRPRMFQPRPSASGVAGFWSAGAPPPRNRNSLPHFLS